MSLQNLLMNPEIKKLIEQVYKKELDGEKV